VIGLDANVLARYLIEDAGDAEAQRQREAARRLIESGEMLFVPTSVLLELEWVMRGFYGFTPRQCGAALQAVLTMPRVQLEDRAAAELALAHHAAGMDFADALHYAACRECAEMASFDDRRFARRTQALGLAPRVRVPR
jgi:predicted nucleic-acid-binding protein